ncbi:MAG: hypothetical protein M1820_006510 [Bogoriella megaspora]|nr:MAG: hypothetical protein M1820_006510 [Bogoriella megaspora]
MGNVSSKAGDGSPVYVRDQTRFSVASLTVTTSKNRTIVNVVPNAFPTDRYVVKRESGDEAVVEYVQDPETLQGGPPSFLVRLPNDEDLYFNFTFNVRQTPPISGAPNSANGQIAVADTVIQGLTFIHAPSPREIDNLVTREFNADPNLHKRSDVTLIGDGNFATNGDPAVQFQWSWKWKPPKINEDRGGGWRNTCSIVEYNQRAHSLDTLAVFSFWVHNTSRTLGSPKTHSPSIELNVPQRLRVPSARSVQSRISDSDGADGYETQEPQSPLFNPIPEDGLGLSTAATNSTTKVDVSCQRPGEDISLNDDGPVFRATMKSLEQKTGNMRLRMKRVLRAAEAAQEAQVTCNEKMQALLESLRDASSSNANAVRPALDHYFEKIAQEILSYEKQNSTNLQKMVIDPISKLYNFDIKAVESKKKDFDEESRDYYAYVSRYLGQRQDSMKEKKRAESDSKYQNKRRTFELKRFDYSSFMQDLHGGRKDQEILSQLTKYADAQARGYLTTAKKVEEMMPQLEALSLEVQEADKEFQLQRTEREEKRRVLEKSTKPYKMTEASLAPPSAGPNTPAGSTTSRSGLSDIEPPKSSHGSSNFRSIVSSPPTVDELAPLSGPDQPLSPPSAQGVTPEQSKFKGIRDLEDNSSSSTLTNGNQHRKEGLLWALSRPGSHVDPVGINKQAWHKYWIVLDQGKLSEYVNWKQKLDLHMDPIDLRVASVREARNAERRFCFEVITPHFTRVYQATSEEDMKSWISSINNALQSAFEAKGPIAETSTSEASHSTRRDIAAVLTGKSSSFSGGHRSSAMNMSSTAVAKAVARHATVGDKPAYKRTESDEHSAKLLNQLRENDAGNKYCADCGSESRVEWVSINLGIVVCIECSGIHRSLGTHISKMRSLTLDTAAFTQDIIELLLQIGNRVSNMIWEARLDRSQKPLPHATREQRLRFITAKYADHAYVEPIDVSHSHYRSPDDMLLASIKQNRLQAVLHAIALRANLNAHDKSRNTHAVFLALAAADPAMPGSSAATPSSSPNRPTTPQPSPPPTRKPFPIAELLLQNGADVPTLPAPIPLTSAAKSYIDYKMDQKLGRQYLNTPQQQNHSSSGTDTSGISNRNSAHYLSSSPNTSATVTAVPPRSPPSASSARRRPSFGVLRSSNHASSGDAAAAAAAADPGIGFDGGVPRASNGDTLTALPSIVAGNGTTPSERAREREREREREFSAGARLVKRNSSAGRLGRSSVSGESGGGGRETPTSGGGGGMGGLGRLGGRASVSGESGQQGQGQGQGDGKGTKINWI